MEMCKSCCPTSWATAVGTDTLHQPLAMDSNHQAASGSTRRNYPCSSLLNFLLLLEVLLVNRLLRMVVEASSLEPFQVVLDRALRDLL